MPGWALPLMLALAPAWAAPSRYAFRLYEPAGEPALKALSRELTALGGTGFRLALGEKNGSVELPAEQLSNAKRISSIKIIEREVFYSLEGQAYADARYLIRYRDTPDEIIDLLNQLGASRVKVLFSQPVIMARLPRDPSEALLRRPDVVSVHTDIQFTGCEPTLE